MDSLRIQAHFPIKGAILSLITFCCLNAYAGTPVHLLAAPVLNAIMDEPKDAKAKQEKYGAQDGLEFFFITKAHVKGDWDSPDVRNRLHALVPHCHTPAMIALAECTIREWHGCRFNRDVILGMAKRARDLGDPNGAVCEANFYLGRYGNSPELENQERAVQLLKAAERAGSLPSAHALTRLELETATPATIGAIMAKLRRLALKGEYHAIETLFEIYWCGTPLVPRDEEEAKRWVVAHYWAGMPWPTREGTFSRVLTEFANLSWDERAARYGTQPVQFRSIPDFGQCRVFRAD